GSGVVSRPALAEATLVTTSSRHLVKLVNLARSLADFIEETPREFHRLILSRSFEQRVAADDFFRLGERTVCDGDFAAGALVHANAGCAEMNALGCDQPSRLHALFDELAH